MDIGAYYKGYHGDSAKTHGVGMISEEDRKLIEVTRESFYEGIKFAKLGYRLSEDRKSTYRKYRSASHS